MSADSDGTTKPSKPSRSGAILSDKAERELDKRVDNFRIRLRRDAIKEAKNDEGDIVSKNHIDRAADGLRIRVNSPLRRSIDQASLVVGGGGLGVGFDVLSGQAHLSNLTLAIALSGVYLTIFGLVRTSR